MTTTPAPLKQPSAKPRLWTVLWLKRIAVALLLLLALAACGWLLWFALPVLVATGY